ncbi:hypothetical protein DPMN_132905 [Dreissena polymorpha]|uniref:Uncharacterized protein n=1 Tax=Dreissena polymorpha TaxID=45954 RepID=A0A9D4FUN4_DREPO|nr:hypothetical protein DPMN_132905 [Dreissena polymorpha]
MTDLCQELGGGAFNCFASYLSQRDTWDFWTLADRVVVIRWRSLPSTSILTISDSWRR